MTTHEMKCMKELFEDRATFNRDVHKDLCDSLSKIQKIDDNRELFMRLEALSYVILDQAKGDDFQANVFEALINHQNEEIES